jgi:drug/metabolite transporter (DMT)-like permease
MNGERALGGAMVFAAAAGFGTLAIFGKLAAAVGLSTPTLLVFRFVVATAVIWGFLGLRGRAERLSGRPLRVALGIGVVYAVMTVLFFVGIDFLSAGLAAVVFYTYPVHVFVISAVALNERPTTPKLLALVAAVAGVGLIVGANTAGASPLGIVVVLLAAVAYATYTTGSRMALSSVDSELLTATAMVATTVSMLPYGVAVGGLSIPTGVAQWALVLGIGLLGTAVPIVLFVRGLDRIEASHASVIGTAEPLVTVVLGVILLGETATPVFVVGGGLVLCGVLLIQRTGRPTGMVAH